ncbi:hypothetical protein [Pseudonocardia sp. KRD291]|uniref:hypothetical protein n=1 Tax=Pseudonocardia sp. KRD291 TaxID=2792007 RepID=UPI001C4A19C1|nr:hypothetical protein [Pseudonocardia sp. KRD291]MBW0107017.1 hypothetical protein [Pseudonocardia sp. KRD291]
MTAPCVVPGRTDRTREAASARGRELAATHRRLADGHHADLRAVLGLTRLSCSAGLAADLDDLARRAAERADGSGRTGRAQLPSWLAGELDGIRRRSAERFDAVAGPAVRRVAAGLCPGAAPIPLPPPIPLPGAPAGAGPAPAGAAPAAGPARRGPWAGIAADPRLPAGAAGIPLLAAGGLGWATALTVAGVVLLLGSLAFLRSEASERARVRVQTSAALAAVRVEAERDLARRAIEVERAAGAALHRAVTDRRNRVAAELAGLRDARR